MLHFYNKCEHSIKAVSETLTLYFKEHSAITDFNTVPSIGFYCFAAAMLFYSSFGGGVERKVQHIQVLFIKERSCCVLTACTGKRSWISESGILAGASVGCSYRRAYCQWLSFYCRILASILVHIRLKAESLRLSIWFLIGSKCMLHGLPLVICLSVCLLRSQTST